MSNLFRNSKAAMTRPTQAKAVDQTASTTKERRLIPRPLPLPDVVEGNDDSDWSLWQDSVEFHDSQMQAAWPVTEPGQLQGATPSMEPDAIDAFASVHKNSA